MLGMSYKIRDKYLLIINLGIYTFTHFLSKIWTTNIDI
jgi:hypothetical protein